MAANHFPGIWLQHDQQDEYGTIHGKNEQFPSLTSLHWQLLDIQLLVQGK